MKNLCSIGGDAAGFCCALKAQFLSGKVAKVDAITLFIIPFCLSVIPLEAFAQAETSSIQRNFDGSVEVDNNAFDFRTGELENESNIPLPLDLPESVNQGVPLPVTRSQEVSNNITITSDVPFITESFLDISEQDGSRSSFTIQPETLEIDVEFDLRYRPGAHVYGEGIEVTVLDRDGNVVSQESTFVRGDNIQIGPNGEQLPEESRLTATYGADEQVQLRVLNLREDGGPSTESGIYFSSDGEFIVEDLQNGGDLDFNDGEYVRLPGGRGEAIAQEESIETSTETQVDTSPLAPDMRTEETIERDMITAVDEVTTVTEISRDYGSVELSPLTTSPSVLLGHATGAQAVTGEQLIYNRYSAAGEARLGSDGVGVTGQLRPLNVNPNAAPTLLTGNLTFNPFVGDNEAGVTSTVSLTQFLHPTHRLARDGAGNVLTNPITEGSPLIEPIGLFNNRRMVGFVRDMPPRTVRGEALVSSNGIFDLPPGQVVIEPPSPEQVGRGNAAYTDNVGGLLLDKTDGSMVFVPQWTADGYAQEPILLTGGETARVIYALVPQQAGQNLQLGQTYEVTPGDGGHQITQGGFTIISADRQFQNFIQEMPSVYAVEDTLAGPNAATTLFSGLQGFYAQELGGEPVSTVDVAVPAEADARVGNLIFPQSIVAGFQGQEAYADISLAAGFYLNTSLAGGFGNQRDEVVRSEVTENIEFDLQRDRLTRNTFMTPRTQLEEVVLETSQRSQVEGQATFDIDSDGLLTNVVFNPMAVLSQEPATTREVARNIREQRGEDVLVESVVVEESFEPISATVLESDEQMTTDSDSYPNFSPVRGEILLGGVLNFGNTPWTAAANTLRAEFFARDTVLGRGRQGSETGWRAEVLFHPFGEIREPAHRYDATGNVVPLYETVPLVDSDGVQVTETLTTTAGDEVDLPENQFVVDDAGDRIPLLVGTGKAKGPGAYIRLEDVIDDGDSLIVAGGIQFSF
ncbi:MAG: hypothetical protein AAGC93_18945 [Cyanobacteria bacterium P01_F01_bin.53]